MKTVLLITAEDKHRKLYEPGLKKHFAVEYRPRAGGGPGTVDALIYDLPRGNVGLDVEWLRLLDLPTVVLTPDETLSIPARTNRRILVYPVSMDRIIQELAKLGVTP